MKLCSEDVTKFLPHREPFLFVDSIESVARPAEKMNSGILAIKELVGTNIIAHYKTKKDHPIFKGHFPGNPILPGVIQVEMMAQASSFIYMLSFDKPFEQTMDVALVSVSSAKFRKPVTPEMDLEIKTLCAKVRGPMVESHCQIFCKGILMSEAVVLASVKFM